VSRLQATCGSEKYPAGPADVGRDCRLRPGARRRLVLV